MSKKSVIARLNKIKKRNIQFLEKRKFLKHEFKNNLNFQKIIFFQKKLQKLPKSSSITFLENRCWKTGKARGYFRFFGLSRNILRELALDSFLPGIKKAN
jgi:small subunit ribosomal protein S14